MVSTESAGPVLLIAGVSSKTFIRSIFLNCQAGLFAGFLESQNQVETLASLSSIDGTDLVNNTVDP